MIRKRLAGWPSRRQPAAIRSVRLPTKSAARATGCKRRFRAGVRSYGPGRAEPGAHRTTGPCPRACPSGSAGHHRRPRRGSAEDLAPRAPPTRPMARQGWRRMRWDLASTSSKCQRCGPAHASLRRLPRISAQDIGLKDCRQTGAIPGLASMLRSGRRTLFRRAPESCVHRRTGPTGLGAAPDIAEPAAPAHMASRLPLCRASFLRRAG